MSSHCSKSPFQNAWSEGCLDYCPPGHYKSVSSNTTNWTGGFIKYVFSNYVSKQSKCLENPGKLWNIERTQVLRTHTVPGITRIWKDSNRPRSLDARIVWEKWSPPTHLFLQGFRYLSFFRKLPDHSQFHRHWHCFGHVSSQNSHEVWENASYVQTLGMARNGKMQPMWNAFKHVRI